MKIFLSVRVTQVRVGSPKYIAQLGSPAGFFQHSYYHKLQSKKKKKKQLGRVPKFDTICLVLVTSDNKVYKIANDVKSDIRRRDNQVRWRLDKAW